VLLPFLLSLTLAITTPTASVGDALCPPQLQLAHPEQCPALGPGVYAEQLAAARLPDPIPDVPLEHLARPAQVVDFTYARVTTPDAPLFASVEDALAGNVKKSIGKGFIFVSLEDTVQQGDQVFYKIHSGDYIRAADVSEVKPTGFQGELFSADPAYPVGWIVSNVRPSQRPGMPAPRKGAMLWRGVFLQIFATVKAGQWDWYLVGPNQWVEQRKIAKLTFNAPPEGVTGRWIQVDLYEQTLAAYEDNQLVYATLVSSGLDRWATEPGLFHIWARLKADRMSGSYELDGSDYYSLEAVPWVMYFDGSRALHGEYWHDRLGFKRSHGCVNLSPLDAHWLFNWTEKGTPVWVYDSSSQVRTDSVAEGP
jgi:L,D-transpeptidase-like protein